MGTRTSSTDSSTSSSTTGRTTSQPPPPKAPSSTPTLTVLTPSDVKKILATLDPELALGAQAEAFKALSDPSEKVYLPHRHLLNYGDRYSLYMPSRYSAGEGIKIASQTQGSTALLDIETGKVKALVSAKGLTPWRNAAGSALAVRCLPTERPPTNLLIFGSGGQANAHARLFLRFHHSIQEVNIVVRRPTPRAETLVSTLKADFPKITFGLIIAPPPLVTGEAQPTDRTLSQVVHNANIIITLTPSTVPLFNSVDVCSGTSLVLVGSYTPEMREVDTNLIRRAGIVVVDSRDACEVEAGELIQDGVGRDRMVELGELLSDDFGALRRKIDSSGDVRVFKSVSRRDRGVDEIADMGQVGVAIQDVAIAELVLRQAQQQGLGTIVPNWD